MTNPAMQITIEVRNVYGTPKVYPVCDRAKAFAKIAGTNTLTHAALCQIEALGYLIVPTANTDWKSAA
jgi:formate-dependent phosphoribosylglycinamide formyltransferase (GAR transformylase)